jgi:small subunit ribosomal protein S1
MAIEYKPEGEAVNITKGKSGVELLKILTDAMEKRIIVEGMTRTCDSSQNLLVDIGDVTGTIYRDEVARGVKEGKVRDIAIISRVGKAVSFIVKEVKTDDEGLPFVVLSRREAQEECYNNYLSKLKLGDIIDAKVTSMDYFGTFVDLGCGITGLIPIQDTSVSRVVHPKDRFRIGQNIKVAVKAIESDGKIRLTHKELLGTWEENVAKFKEGDIVSGVISSVENYGLFVELSPNLSGLTEELKGAKIGQNVLVSIRKIVPERMKIKLAIVKREPGPPKRAPIQYYISSDHIDSWAYSPESSDKLIMTAFTDFR